MAGHLAEVIAAAVAAAVTDKREGTYEQRMCYSKIKRQWMPDNKTEADIA